MQVNDLLPMWIFNNLKAARFAVNEAQKAYDNLEHKDSTYAKSILRVLEIKEKVVALWDAAADECGRE